MDFLTEEEVILIGLDDPIKIISEIMGNRIQRYDKMREIICSFNVARVAYWYAQNVDKGPNDLTRKVCCTEGFWAYQYALNVDHTARNDTRTASCELPWTAFRYAENVDRRPTNETREASNGSGWNRDYQEWEAIYWFNLKVPNR